MTVICPCCGSEIVAQRTPIEALMSIEMATVPRTIIRVLSNVYPRAVPADFLLEEIYRGSTEPEHARGALQIQICRVREKLAIYGWTVPKNQSGRGHSAFYKLEPLP